MLEFGIPSKRSRKEPFFPNEAVLAILPAPEESGKAFKFKLSDNAIEQLGLDLDNEAKVAFSFGDGSLFIANADLVDVPEKDSYNVGKTTHTFSNRKAHEYITEHYRFVTQDDNSTIILHLQNTPIQDGVYQLYQEDTQTQAVIVDNDDVVDSSPVVEQSQDVVDVRDLV